MDFVALEKTLSTTKDLDEYKSSILQMLDYLIDFWREQKVKATDPGKFRDACVYVDAYQSIRMNLFGSIKE